MKLSRRGAIAASLLAILPVKKRPNIIPTDNQTGPDEHSVIKVRLPDGSLQWFEVTGRPFYCGPRREIGIAGGHYHGKHISFRRKRGDTHWQINCMER